MIVAPFYIYFVISKTRCNPYGDTYTQCIWFGDHAKAFIAHQAKGLLELLVLLRKYFGGPKCGS